MTNREKMLAGEPYDASDAELAAMRQRAHRLSRQYGLIIDDMPSMQQVILRELLADGSGLPYMEAPIFLDYGCHTHFGAACYTNYNFVCLDTCEVLIGDNVMFGPNVTIATPMHPLVADERDYSEREDGGLTGLEYGKPITIGSSCWIASNVVICGGVSIGEECVIGAGSVVTRSIPSGCLAAGNPCRVIRAITDDDRMFSS